MCSKVSVRRSQHQRRLRTVNLAREAGIERIVYLSMIHADQGVNVPQFTGKHTVTASGRPQVHR